MAVPVIESTAFTRSTSEVASLTLTNKPTGVVSGNLLLLICMAECTSNDWGTTPTGWTAEITDSIDGKGNALYSRIASGTSADDDPVIGMDAGTDYMMGWYLRISGAHATNYLDVINARDTGWEVDTCLSWNTLEDDCLCFAYICGAHTNIHPYGISSGTGWPGSVDATNRAPDNSTTGGVSMGYVTRTLATAGSVPAVTFTYTTSAFTLTRGFSIAPAAGGSIIPQNPFNKLQGGPFGGPF